MQSDFGYTTVERLNCNTRTITVRAIRNSDQCRVIIKSLASTHPTATQLARFNYAYELQKRFDHAGIVKVIDWISDTSTPQMVLEDIGAIPLSDFVDQQPEKRLTINVFLNIALQISTAVAEIHRQHVVHKDLHPGNILVHPKTLHVQITDFDLSSLLSREQPAVQPPSTLEGVLGFISPEQTGRMNRSIDYRTDFYTLGVLFYRLLTGQMPFEEDSPIAMVHAHIARLPEPIDNLRPQVPAPLARLVDKLMAKNAEARYQSAIGLQFDLNICRQQWQSQRTIELFPLATHDLADRLQISQKLYGREHDIEQLVQAFGRTLHGQPQLLTVCGYSGIGKSSLVQEAHKPIAMHGGWFISGKFDQFQRHIPFAALHDALKSWVQLVLAENRTHLDVRRQVLLNSMGANARVLVDFQPDLALILGELPEVAKLGPQETQNRFYQTMQLFFSCVTAELPLVLFLDDLQWADAGTLSLLKALMKDDNRQLLLILAWRENEVGEGHPALKTVTAICDELPEGRCQHITLQPLSLNEVEHLLQDSLHRQDGITEFAQLIHKKTAGNPFFISEFLRTLYSDGMLWVAPAQQRWEWSLERIRDKSMTDNVIDLMIAKMCRLPDITQQLVQLAACIGSRFDLSTLAMVSEQTPQSLQRKLWPALNDGLLLQESSEWCASETSLDAPPTELAIPNNAAQEIRYRFLHDRAQQAAYQSLDEDIRQHTHLKIARLLQNSCDSMDDQTLFTIVGHYDDALPLINTLDERLLLATLNDQASQLARRASAWSAAARYASIARTLLPTQCWRDCYSIARSIFLSSIECEFLVSHADEASVLADIALAHLTDLQDKIRISLLLVNGFMARGKRNEAIVNGLEGLRYCGINVPDESILEESWRRVQQEFDQAPIPLAERLFTVDHISDEAELTSKLLSSLLLASYVSGQKQLNAYLCVQGIQLLLKHGLCDETVSLVSQYLALLLRDQKIDNAEALATLAIKYAERAANRRQCIQLYLFTGAVVGTHFLPLSEAIALQWKGYEIAMEHGDIASGIACFSNIVINRFAKGDALSEISRHLDQLIELMNRHQIVVSAGKQYQRLLTQMQYPDTPDQLATESFPVEEWQIIQASTFIAFVEHLRLQWWFWSGQYEKAIKQLPIAEKKLDLIPGFAPNIDHLIIESLLIGISITPESPASEHSLARLEAAKHRLEMGASHCPTTYQHKLWLVRAELARITAPPQQVIECYRQAAQAARQHQFIQFEALAHERLGQFLHTLGWDEFAAVSIKEAHYLYGRWGCTARQTVLAKQYPSFANLYGLESRRISSVSTEHNTEIKAAQWLDLESIIKSNLALSSELKLNRLLSKMLHIMLENAGAQSAALVMQYDGQLSLLAKVRAATGNQPAEEWVEQAIPLTDASLLPDDMVRFALLTGKPLNVQDTVQSEAWRHNTYVERNKPLSVLCLPVHYRDRISGVLYLENMLTTQAFTQERVQLLQMLLTQAAISLENAQLFDEVQTLNSSLEQKVDQRTAELNAANKELEAFSYSVSHDLRSPIRNINGFSKMLMEQFRDALGEDGRDLLHRINRNTEKMAQLISGLLELSKVTRCDLVRTQIDLATMAKSIGEELQHQFPLQQVTWVCTDHAPTLGDARLLYSALENLLNNAWKYTSKTPNAHIEFGSFNQEGKTVFFVKDNGAGFDMRYVQKLFSSFQRLHHERDFSGTGIGLATVYRIIQRHGGTIWAEGLVNQGATFYFTLGTPV